jgi:hypothetical protein
MRLLRIMGSYALTASLVNKHLILKNEYKPTVPFFALLNRFFNLSNFYHIWFFDFINL